MIYQVSKCIGGGHINIGVCWWHPGGWIPGIGILSPDFPPWATHPRTRPPYALDRPYCLWARPLAKNPYSSGPNKRVVPNNHVGWTVQTKFISMWSLINMRSGIFQFCNMHLILLVQTKGKVLKKLYPLYSRFYLMALRKDSIFFLKITL